MSSTCVDTIPLALALPPFPPLPLPSPPPQLYKINPGSPDPTSTTPQPPNPSQPSHAVLIHSIKPNPTQNPTNSQPILAHSAYRAHHRPHFSSIHYFSPAVRISRFHAHYSEEFSFTVNNSRFMIHDSEGYTRTQHRHLSTYISRKIESDPRPGPAELKTGHDSCLSRREIFPRPGDNELWVEASYTNSWHRRGRDSPKSSGFGIGETRIKSQLQVAVHTCRVL